MTERKYDLGLELDDEGTSLVSSGLKFEPSGERESFPFGSCEDWRSKRESAVFGKGGSRKFYGCNDMSRRWVLAGRAFEVERSDCGQRGSLKSGARAVVLLRMADQRQLHEMGSTCSDDWDTVLGSVLELIETRAPIASNIDVRDTVERLVQCYYCPEPCQLNEPRIKAIDEPTAAMQRVIGNYGTRRITKFMEIEEGWDGGRGRAFSKASLGVFEYFLQHEPQFSIATPSVFLTHNGNIQIEWSDLDGNDIEIEFFPDHFEYYVSRLDEESSLGLEAAPLLVEKIGAVQHFNE